MPIHEFIEALCKAAALVDPDDLPGLTSMFDQLGTLRCEFTAPEHQRILDCIDRVSKIIEQIVLQDTQDAAASLDLSRRGIEFLSSVLHAEERGQTADEVGPSPFEQAGPASAPAPAPALTTTGYGPAGDADPQFMDNGGTSPPGADLAPASEPAAAGLVEFPAGWQGNENLAEFLTEAREHIASAEQSMLELERQPENAELVNTIFRAFHTIKGVAGFLNLTPIVTLAHHGECLLDLARSGRLTLDASRLDVILQACDGLNQLLSTLEGATPPTMARFQEMIAALQRAAGAGSPATAPALSPASAPSPGAAEAVPGAAPSVPASPSAGATSTTEPKPSSRPPTESGASPVSAPGVPVAHAPKPADQTVKVSTGRMDALVDMVGELVIAQQMVVQAPAIRGIAEQQLQRDLAMVGKIIRDLQTVAMSLRMVPIKSTFQKMARLVRDVASKAGKRVVFHAEGEEVELDRNVVEAISDPLVHLVRNACDHGVEPPSERAATGKSESANIWLRAYHSGGSIVVEIEDDGRGLVREKILSKAVEKGLLPPERAPQDLSDSEVFELIFLPGFSTAQQVTDISGRGVGMDVVRRNIESLRGRVDIRSTPGKGTVFSMRLPLTLAIIDGMVVRVGSERYVIPTLSIERTFRPREGDLHTVMDQGTMAKVRDGLLPVHRLDAFLRPETRASRESGAARIDLLVVVEAENTRACLVIDEIIGQQQVVIKSLGRSMQSIRGVSGGAILGDGRVALILDVAGIVTQPTTAAAGAPAAAA